MPQGIIAGCIAIIALYALTVHLFLRKQNRSAKAMRTENLIMIIFQIFVTVYGLFCIAASQPLTHQAEITFVNLMYQCETSPYTHRLYEYSQVLHNIRATPACAKMYSVEECAGYEEAAPYTPFLKGMENSFRCAGFCMNMPQAQVSAPKKASKAGLKQSLLSTDRANSAADTMPVPTYPPTLFSNMNYQASCEGMAARDMKMYAGEIGREMFYQGIYLVSTAAIVGAMTLGSFCIEKS